MTGHVVNAHLPLLGMHGDRHYSPLPMAQTAFSEAPSVVGYAHPDRARIGFLAKRKTGYTKLHLTGTLSISQFTFELTDDLDLLIIILATSHFQ